MIVSIIFSTVVSVMYVYDKNDRSMYHVYEEMNALCYNKTKYELVVAVD